jgi:transposase
LPNNRLLPLIPAGLLVVQVLPAPERITIVTTPQSHTSACPDCDLPSSRTHSRYNRTLADLPWQGRAVRIQVRARRFRCVTASCSRQIFAERLPEVARPWARRTSRLGDIQRHVGLALGGRPGSRLATRLAIPAGRDPLLRLVRTGAAATTAPPSPRVLGVDDFAFRRGQRCGTILVDLERRRILDLRPDREGATFAAWLRARPGVEIIARGRGGAYADGARVGAPHAVQVADRWHLLRNCSDALQQVLDRHRTTFHRAAQAVLAGATAAAPPSAPRPPTKLEARQRARQADRDTRFADVARLARAGRGIKAITRETGLSRNTVRRWLASSTPPDWRKGERVSIIDPYLPYLRERMAQGCRNATRLWREIRERGFPGQVILVRAWGRRLEAGALIPPRRVAVPIWRRPTPRAAVRMLLSDVQLADMDTAFIAALRADPAIGLAAEQAQAFAAMVREKDVARFRPWLEGALGGPLGGFAEGLRRDRDAVEAGLRLPWSTGPVEGRINKLKLVKRSMYGRGKLDLLQHRLVGT